MSAYDKAEAYLNTLTTSEVADLMTCYSLSQTAKRERLVTVPMTKADLVVKCQELEAQQLQQRYGQRFFALNDYAKESIAAKSVTELKVILKYAGIPATKKDWKRRTVQLSKAEMIGEILMTTDFCNGF